MSSIIVALDLGTTHIRGVEAEIRNGHPPKIRKIHTLPIESEIISAGEIVNETGLANAIEKLWEEAKFKSKFVVSMASGDAQDTRIVSNIPWSPPEDFKRLLPHYLRDNILLETDDEYYFDAHTLHEYFQETADANGLGTGNSNRYKTILVSAVKQTFADSFVRAVEKAGLRPYALDIMPLALIRSQSKMVDIPENASVVSVEIGGDVTTIIVHKNYQPVYINTASFFGGVRVTKEIAQELGITLNEAEMLKTSFSLTPEQRNEMVTVNFFEDGTTSTTKYESFTNQQKEQAAGIVSREVTNIVTHIGDIVEDAFGNTTDTPFKIVLSGGGAGIHTLLSRLQTELGIPTIITQPFVGLENKIDDPDVLNNQHIYASVYGLLVGQHEIK